MKGHRHPSHCRIPTLLSVRLALLALLRQLDQWVPSGQQIQFRYYQLHHPHQPGQLDPWDQLLRRRPKYLQ